MDRVEELTCQLLELGETDWCQMDCPDPPVGTVYYGVWNGAGYEKFFFDRESAAALCEAGGEGYEFATYGRPPHIE